jgi:hypothetical protein
VGLRADKFNSALWAKQMSARHRDEYTDGESLSTKAGYPSLSKAT